MHNILDRFQNAPVLVVGDIMLDEFVRGSVTRISPEAPVPVVEVQGRSFVAGGAANTSVNVTSLGGTATILGVIGTDSAGDTLVSKLVGSGVDVGLLHRHAQRPTTTKTRIVAGMQQLVRIDHELRQDISQELEATLLASLGDRLSGFRACIVSDYGKGLITPRFAQSLIEMCHRATVPILVDPKGVDYQKYCGATLVKPNLKEAEQVLNRELRTSALLHQAGQDLMDLLGPRTSVLITQGAQGMTLFQRGSSTVTVPALAREVYDVTGAGDTVASTIGLSLAAGATLEQACRLASAAAAVVVAKVGTATVTREELHPLLP